MVIYQVRNSKLTCLYISKNLVENLNVKLLMHIDDKIDYDNQN